MGGRFCNMCGTPVGTTAAGRKTAADGTTRSALRPVTAGDARRRESGMGTGGGASFEDDANASGSTPSTLAAAGISLAVLLGVLFIVLPRLGERNPANRPPPPASAAAPFAAAGGADPSAIDLGSMTPEEAATRLFNRVMTSVSQGDSVSARQFAPMAIDAYGLVPDPDLDSRYHIALLELVNRDFAAARATAESILVEVPDHLFGLYTAAQTEQEMGNDEAARTLYQRFLDVYDAELALQRVEYTEHATILPGMRDAARLYLGTP